jgi:hypothetical protein
MTRRSKRLSSEVSADAVQAVDVSEELPSETQTSGGNLSTWTQTQNEVSSNLLPLVSQQDDLYSLLHPGESCVNKETLVKTCQQLFRYIEYLAELQEQLKTNSGEGERMVFMGS